MKIKIDHNTLLCPSCGGINLYHEKIEVFSREEDSLKGLHTTIENTFPNVNTDLRENPSSRRDGMLIHFHCENCGDESTLSLSQHKGSTFIDWKKD